MTPQPWIEVVNRMIDCTVQPEALRFQFHPPSHVSSTSTSTSSVHFSRASSAIFKKDCDTSVSVEIPQHKPPTWFLWGKLGRLTHYAVDAVLISTILAGMRRSTGLTPSFQTEKIGDNKEVSKWVEKYLSVGEWVMDAGVGLAGQSGWFKRTR
ncbi:hypothetical protein BJ170DRAFT_416841 [Xylariales sp. AK1849]|nr:hypothetical protein BJ170DRAFT_416841 [Xylariales sp. AK1849]